MIWFGKKEFLDPENRDFHNFVEKVSDGFYSQENPLFGTDRFLIPL
jgi:hypothetical protein